MAKGNRNLCDKCKRLMSTKAVEYCQDNKDIFNGKMLCDFCLGWKERGSNKKNIEDYKVTDGIIIRVRNEDEKLFLKQAYKDYERLDFEVPDPNAQLQNLLTMRLQIVRLSNELANIKDVNQVTSLTNAIKGINEQITKIQDALQISRAKMKEKESSAVEIFKEQMRDAILYFAENDGHRTGIGICDKCNKRIIFRGNFETLESELVNYLEEFITDIVEHRDFDLSTNTEKERYKKINNKLKNKYEGKLTNDLINFYSRLMYLLKIRKLPESYVTYHEKEISESYS